MAKQAPLLSRVILKFARKVGIKEHPATYIWWG